MKISKKVIGIGLGVVGAVGLGGFAYKKYKEAEIEDEMQETPRERLDEIEEEIVDEEKEKVSIVGEVKEIIEKSNIPPMVIGVGCASCLGIAGLVCYEKIFKKRIIKDVVDESKLDEEFQEAQEENKQYDFKDLGRCT